MLRLGTFWHLTRWRGAPVHVHWTVPVAVLALTAWSGRALPWLLCALVILLHEIAHAEAARRLGAAVHAIYVAPLGGVCLYEDVLPPLERALVAAAGPAFHLVALAAAAAFARGFGAALGGPGHDALMAFFGVNLLALLTNALPIRPLDGAEAWTLPARLWARLRRRRPRPYLDS